MLGIRSLCVLAYLMWASLVRRFSVVFFFLMFFANLGCNSGSPSCSCCSGKLRTFHSTFWKRSLLLEEPFRWIDVDSSKFSLVVIQCYCRGFVSVDPDTLLVSPVLYVNSFHISWNRVKVTRRVSTKSLAAESHIAKLSVFGNFTESENVLLRRAQLIALCQPRLYVTSWLWRGIMHLPVSPREQDWSIFDWYYFC